MQCNALRTRRCVTIHAKLWQIMKPSPTNKSLEPETYLFQFFICVTSQLWISQIVSITLALKWKHSLFLALRCTPLLRQQKFTSLVENHDRRFYQSPGYMEEKTNMFVISMWQKRNHIRLFPSSQPQLALIVFLKSSLIRLNMVSVKYISHGSCFYHLDMRSKWTPIAKSKGRERPFLSKGIR